MSFPANANIMTADHRTVLARGVRKGTVVLNPDGRPGAVVCVVVSSASKPFVGRLTPEQNAVIFRRALRLYRLSHGECYGTCPYVGSDPSTEGGSSSVRFDFLIADKCAAVVADGVYGMAWDPTFEPNAAVQLLPGYEGGAVFYE